MTGSFPILMPAPLVATVEEFRATGWDRPDVVLVSPDAYVDHPSFPVALLGRVLQARGFRVCILDRPDVTTAQAIIRFGLPRLFFGISGGAIDSMVANYTAWKKPRSDDPYAPDGLAGGRPESSRHPCMETLCAKPTARRPSWWREGSKPACAVSPITTFGPTRSGAPC